MDNKEHKTCSRTAMTLIERAGYAIYRLETMNVDGCPFAPKIPPELTKIIGDVRREIRRLSR